ncbi:alpha/beta hydrolase [Bdellovibrionota bacterium FG-1]
MKIWKKPRFRFLALAGLGGVVGLGVSLGAVVAWFPLRVAELDTRWTFWRQDIQTVQSAGLNGYLQDGCAKAPADITRSRGCSCVAMIHGLADTAMTWKSLLLWPPQGWTAPTRLVAFDLPGSGRSPAPSDVQEYSVRRQAARVKQALQGLRGCDRWIVVGNSLGGWVASWLALDWPEGVHRLILLDAAGLREGVSAADVHRFFVEPSVAALQDFQARAYFKGRKLPDSVWRAVVARMKQSNAKQVIEAQKPEDFLDDRLPALRKPTLLIWGAADRITLPSLGKRFQSLIPGAIWHEVPECGHLPQKECPLEVIRGIAQMMSFGGA